MTTVRPNLTRTRPTSNKFDTVSLLFPRIDIWPRIDQSTLGRRASLARTRPMFGQIRPEVGPKWQICWSLRPDAPLGMPATQAFWAAVGRVVTGSSRRHVGPGPSSWPRSTSRDARLAPPGPAVVGRDGAVGAMRAALARIAAGFGPPPCPRRRRCARPLRAVGAASGGGAASPARVPSGPRGPPSPALAHAARRRALPSREWTPWRGSASACVRYTCVRSTAAGASGGGGWQQRRRAFQRVAWRSEVKSVRWPGDVSKR